MDIEDFRKRRAELRATTAEVKTEIEEHRMEENRVNTVLQNSDSLFGKLKETFEERTSLTSTDVLILMLATTLQLVRIYFLPKLQEYHDVDRKEHDDPSIIKKENEEIRNYKEKHKKWKSQKSEKGYRSWQEIAFTIKSSL